VSLVGLRTHDAAKSVIGSSCYSLPPSGLGSSVVHAGELDRVIPKLASERLTDKAALARGIGMGCSDHFQLGESAEEGALDGILSLWSGAKMCVRRVREAR
jgi:hypothetical protein